MLYQLCATPVPKRVLFGTAPPQIKQGVTFRGRCQRIVKPQVSNRPGTHYRAARVALCFQEGVEQAVVSPAATPIWRRIGSRTFGATEHRLLRVRLVMKCSVVPAYTPKHQAEEQLEGKLLGGLNSGESALTAADWYAIGKGALRQGHK